MEPYHPNSLCLIQNQGKLSMHDRSCFASTASAHEDMTSIFFATNRKSPLYRIANHLVLVLKLVPSCALVKPLALEATFQKAVHHSVAGVHLKNAHGSNNDNLILMP